MFALHSLFAKKNFPFISLFCYDFLSEFVNATRAKYLPISQMRSD